ncbi:MAG: hypothetical protein JWM59_952 [Verrucomicrobiales bacterium]|nr:hypothetical protein [Verrucomicrobiales bacterium]
MNAASLSTEADDPALLRDYVDRGSERSFAELVRRHLPHVYAGALRRVNGDRALASDVAQTVFADFARKAPGLTHLAVPGGWLHRHAGFVAGKLIDRERRHRRREQEAVQMNTPTEYEADPAWAATAPRLDAALDALPRADRDAIVLRFFEHRDFHAVGAALGISDDTAQKRVSRALEKLRAHLTRRGAATAAVTAAALPGLLLNFAAPHAPAALATVVSGRALALAAAQPAGWLGAFHRASGWRKTALGFAAATAVAAVPLTLQHRRLTETGRAMASATAKPAAPAAPAPAPPLPEAKPGIAQASSIPDLIDQAAALLKGGRQDVSAISGALALLTRIPPDQMRDALTRTAGIADESARGMIYKYLLSYWAESQPFEALQFARTEIPENQRAMVCEGVLTAWAARDPGSLLGWQEKTRAVAPPPIQDSLMATVFKTLVSRDPADAFRRLEQTPAANSRAQALRGIMETIQTDADRVRMLELTKNCQDSDLRLQARRAVVEHWAQRDPAAAAEWVDAAQPAWERTRLMDSLGYAWLQSDPAAAADWWLRRAPGPDTLVKIINVWAQEDPNAAGTWLSRQPPGPQSDTARMTFARQVADLDPASALRWAETVTDPTQREGTIDHIWETWHARDTAEANTFLNTSNWPADRLARMASSK